jgi:hypothetical protein
MKGKQQALPEMIESIELRNQGRRKVPPSYSRALPDCAPSLNGRRDDESS